MEPEASREEGRLTNQQLGIKPEVGYLLKVVFQHRAVARSSQRPAIVTYLVMHIVA